MPETHGPKILEMAVGLIATLASLLYYRHRRDVRKLEKELEELTKELQKIRERIAGGDLKAFKEMDTEREEHWMRWREDLEKRIQSHIDGQREWRYNKYTRDIAHIQRDLYTLIEKVRQLELRRGHGP